MSHAAFVLAAPSPSFPTTSVTSESSQSTRRNTYAQSATGLTTHYETNIRTSHENIAAPSFQQSPVAILWLRIGHLRLADNPAVLAASAQKGRLLPIVTVQQKQLAHPIIAAISNLASQLKPLGTFLILRVADSSYGEAEAVSHIARRVAAARIIVNLSQDLDSVALRSMQQRLRLDVWNGDTVYAQLPPAGLYHARHPPLSDLPQFLPRPPRAALGMQSDIQLDGTAGENGEECARRRLHQALQSKSYSLESLMLSLSDELRLGCLAEVRVRAEFHRSQGNASNANTPDIRRRLSSLKTFFSRYKQTPAITGLSIAAYDVNGGDRRGVEWDEPSQKFVLKEWEHQETERRMSPRERAKEFMRRRRNFLSRAFFPDDVTPDYYSFTAWRFAQRCCSATIGVFGTSSLLFALGIRSGRIGQAAVISWVLKEGLGRVGKMLWAGSMGKDFDVDPKRWRFRSALLYAFGNGLEIVTQIFPASFLVFATAANSMKQVSMLTASATRNAMYRSFGGRSQNIANITAKGEAQIVVADLIGMGCGIRLSKFVSVSKGNVLGVYFLLTALDIFGIYMELRQVVFRTVNAERSHVVIQHFLKKGSCLPPSDVSPKERIFLKPRHESAIRLSSIAKAARNPDELNVLLKVFKREHFMVTTPRSPAGGPCRVVLRKDATNEDVLRAMLMAGYVQDTIKRRNGKSPVNAEEEENILRSAMRNANRNFPSFMKGLKEAGWNTDNLLFSTLKRRGFWGREG